MKHIALKTLAIALATGAALMAVCNAAEAGAIVYTFDQDGCSGTGCGLTSYGTVTLTDLFNSGNPAGVNVKVALSGGSGLVDTGALDFHSMAFNLFGSPSINISGLPSSWTVTGPTSYTPNGGWGTFNFYLDCNAACGPNNPWTSGLDFDITTPSITAASFIDSGTASDTYFIADISNPNGGTPLTGRIGASYTGTTERVPEPLTLSLFAAGLAGMAGIRRRKSLSGATVA
jgi:hypothetical protein